MTTREAVPQRLTFRDVCNASLRAARMAKVQLLDYSPASAVALLLEAMPDARQARDFAASVLRTLDAIVFEETKKEENHHEDPR